MGLEERGERTQDGRAAEKGARGQMQPVLLQDVLHSLQHAPAWGITMYFQIREHYIINIIHVSIRENFEKLDKWENKKESPKVHAQ